MVFGLWKTQAGEPRVEVANEATAAALVDHIVQELLDGRARNEVVRELVRNRWDRKVANQLTLLAQQISKDLMRAPAQRAACARRGAERMQAAYGWIGTGLFAGLLLTVAGANLRRFNLWSLVLVGYGVVEWISGYTLWQPHREFWTPPDADKAQLDSAAKRS